MPEPTGHPGLAMPSPVVELAAEAGNRARLQAIASFLSTCGWGDAAPEPLAADASFRRYYRLYNGGRRAILMDAPPPQEDVAPYVAISTLLRDLGFSAPEIFAEDRTAGFLLIED